MEGSPIRLVVVENGCNNNNFSFVSFQMALEKVPASCVSVSCFVSLTFQVYQS